MRLTIDKTVVPYKITTELIAAGVPVKRQVALLPNNGIEIPLENEDDIDLYIDTINNVLDAHDGIDDIAEVEEGAKQRVKKIPGWATWIDAQAAEWFVEHIDPLDMPDDVKNLLMAYGKILLALHDKNFPNME